MRRLQIVLVLAVVLLLGADRVAAAMAEGRIAAAIASCQRLTQRPGVTIGGFPFLSQVVRGRYGDVRARIEDVRSPQGVTVDRVQANLTGVHVPFGSLLRRADAAAGVDAAAVSGFVSYASLDAAVSAKLPGPLSVQFAPGSAGSSHQVKVTGTWSALVKVQISGTADIAVHDGRLDVSPVPGGIQAPRFLQDEISRLLGGSYPLPPLPLNLQVTAVQAGPDGMSFAATGRGLMLSPSLC